MKNPQPSEKMTIETLANFDKNLLAQLDIMAQKGSILTAGTFYTE